MPYFRVPSSGIDINYLVHAASGEAKSRIAPAILCIHGWTCSLHNYTFQIPFLTSLGFKVITPDLRGHGSSSLDPEKQYSPEVNAADMIALLHSLGYDGSTADRKVLLMGHSAGTVISSIIAVSKPDLVRGAILIDPAYVFTESAAQVLINDIFQPSAAASSLSPNTKLDSQQKNDTDEREEQDEDDNAPLQRLVTQFFGIEPLIGPPSVVPPWLHALITNTTLSTNPEVMKTFFLQGWNAGGPGTWEVFSEWASRTDRNTHLKARLVLYATETGHELEKTLGVREQHDEIVTILDAGHWLHMTRPDQVNGIIKTWLDRLGFLPLIL